MHLKASDCVTALTSVRDQTPATEEGSVPYKDPARQRAAQRDHCRKKRLGALAGRHCERCGTTDELEFHHRAPEEKISHRIWSWSWDRIWAEVAKCEVLCKPCHIAHHVAEADARHGVANRYKRGCRCAECREAHRLEAADWRAMRRARAQPPMAEAA